MCVYILSSICAVDVISVIPTHALVSDSDISCIFIVLSELHEEVCDG